MVNCSAFGCTNRSSNHPELSFHIVTSEKRSKSIRKQWLHNIRRDDDLPKDNSFLFVQPISNNSVWFFPISPHEKLWLGLLGLLTLMLTLTLTLTLIALIFLINNLRRGHKIPARVKSFLKVNFNKI